MAFHFDHVNVSVVSIERAAEFLRVAFPHFVIRGSGEVSYEGVRSAWAHLGTPEEYVSLNESDDMEVTNRDASMQTGINHVGFVVYDLKTLHEKYAARGLKCSFMDESPARMRMYVTDQDETVW